LTLYICLAVVQKLKNELFILAHRLVESNPESHISWFAVGCYYYCTSKQDVARKYFRKSLSINKTYLNALIGIGHSFSAQDEVDQALSAYRHAVRLFKK
jgi:anaphase-promoting complex subunit 6